MREERKKRKKYAVSDCRERTQTISRSSRKTKRVRSSDKSNDWHICAAEKTAVSSSRGSSSGSSIGQQINQIKTENSSKWVVIRFILAKLSQREGLNFELVIQVDVFVTTPNHIETHTMETIQD